MKYKNKVFVYVILSEKLHVYLLQDAVTCTQQILNWKNKTFITHESLPTEYYYQ